MNGWQVIEWTGSIIAIFGTLTLALNLTDITKTWILLGVSNILHATLFNHTDQDGLLFLQIGLLSIWIMGYLNIARKNDSKVFFNLLFGGFVTTILASFLTLAGGELFNLSTIQRLEWASSLMSISASFLMSSQHRTKHLAWPLWVVSGGMLVFLTSQTGQMGLIFLHSSFLLLNLIGFFKNKDSIYKYQPS